MGSAIVHGLRALRNSGEVFRIPRGSSIARIVTRDEHEAGCYNPTCSRYLFMYIQQIRNPYAQ